MISNKVGLIGGGNMARAIGGGLLRGGMHATDLMIAEPLPDTCDRLRQELYGAMVSEDNQVVARQAEILLFAVKPQILKPVCKDLADIVQETRPLVMSIAAGPMIDDIDTWLGGGLSVVRVMPNQPALIDQGISALFANERTSDERKAQAEKIMTAVGHAVWLDSESKMDAVTAVSGTGPSYFYLLIDVMIESAKQYGIELWHPDVLFFEVTDTDTKKLMGRFLLDLHPRENKYSHAAQWGLYPRKRWADGSLQTPLK